MFEFLNKNEDDAINILKKDHDVVKALFDDFENSEKLSEKKKIVAKAVMELKIHATIEEELFYPSLRKKEKVDQDLLNESDEEHHVAKLLIAELGQMDGSEDHWEAKFTVLSENIRHHVKEEEGELFPQARKTDVDFIALGKKLLMRKEQLKKNGVPPCAEEIMMSKQRKGSNDSPAQAAKKTLSTKSAKKAPAPKLVVKRSVASKPIAKAAPKSPAKTARALPKKVRK